MRKSEKGGKWKIGKKKGGNRIYTDLKNRPWGLPKGGFPPLGGRFPPIKNVLIGAQKNVFIFISTRSLF